MLYYHLSVYLRRPTYSRHLSASCSQAHLPSVFLLQFSSNVKVQNGRCVLFTPKAPRSALIILTHMDWESYLGSDYGSERSGFTCYSGCFTQRAAPGFKTFLSYSLKASCAPQTWRFTHKLCRQMNAGQRARRQVSMIEGRKLSPPLAI